MAAPDYINWSKLGSIEYSRAKLREWAYGQNVVGCWVSNPNWFSGGVSWIDLSAYRQAGVLSSLDFGNDGSSWGLKFSGDPDKVDVPYYSALDVSQFTLFAQVKFSDVSGEQYFFSKWDHPECFLFRKRNTNVMRGAIYDTAARTVDGTTALAAGILYSVCFTYDGQNCKIYLDGKLDGSAGPFGTLQTGNSNLQIGYFLFGGAYYFLTGWYPLGMILNIALPEDEIRRLSADPFYMIAQTTKTTVFLPGMTIPSAFDVLSGV